MVRFNIDDSGSIRVEQVTTAPAVYLDHWALRKISDDTSLAKKIRDALDRSHGTLMLSWLNLIEFTKVEDSRHAVAAESFIDSLLPNVFFLEINPFTVIERENALLAGGPLVQPHGDMQFLKFFAERNPGSVKPFTGHNLFSLMNSDRLSTSFEALADTIAEQAEALRSRMSNDLEFERRVRRLPTGPEIQRGTRYILRELARPFLVDRHIRINRNNAIDLVHAVVPVAYCDIVLLDKHWCEQVSRMRSRFTEAEMQVSTAEVYSGGRDEMARFCSALEARDG